MTCSTTLFFGSTTSKTKIQTWLKARCIIDANNCWLWQRAINGQGYGVLDMYKGHAKNPWTQRAHKLSYIVFKELVPENMLVLHNCNNRACINPEHLRLGTHADNHADRTKRYPNYPNHIGGYFQKVR